MTDFFEYDETELREAAAGMESEIYSWREENERLRDILNSIQYLAQYTAGKWTIDDLMMDKIAIVLGNKS